MYLIHMADCCQCFMLQSLLYFVVHTAQLGLTIADSEETSVNSARLLSAGTSSRR